MIKLDKEEKKIVHDYETGQLKSVASAKEIQRYQGYARETFQKDRRVNIRISSKDLEGLQKKAIQEGLPYQTLIASILHKFITGRLKTA